MSTYNFNQQVMETAQYLTPYAINLTRDSEAAKDLQQETIYRALTNSTKFTEGTNLKAWLFTIMRNIFINNYRRKTRQKTIIDTTENQFFINSGKVSVGNHAEGNLIMKDVSTAIDTLSNTYRIPFVMHLKGFKYQEIADDLGVPLGTVKSRIFFARQALQKQLKSYRINQSDVAELEEKAAV